MNVKSLFNEYILSKLSDTELWEAFERYQKELGDYADETIALATELTRRDWDPYPVTEEDAAEWRAATV